MRRSLLLLLLLPGSLFAADLDLGPGSDLRTLIGGVAPGDTVTLSGGEYVLDGSIVLRELAGTEASPVVIRAAEGATPVLRMDASATIFDIDVSSWVRISGLTLRGGDTGNPDDNYNHSGISISEGSSNIVLENLDIGFLRNSAVGIGDASAVTVRGCELHDLSNGNGVVAGCSDGNCWLADGRIEGNWIHHLTESSGIWIHNAGQGNAIVDNVVHNVGSRGIRVGSTADGPENIVERNAVWTVGGNCLVAVGPSTMRNNVAFDCTGNGIRTDGDSASGFADVRITHNTIWDTEDDGIEVRNWAGKTGCVLANNAVANTNWYALQADEGHIDDGNLIVGNVVTGLVRGFDTLLGHYAGGYGEGDFEDAINWNFYPVDGSALVDAGDSSGAAFVPSTDFNGAAREGDAPDVGAYERVEPSNPGWEVREGFKPTGPLVGDEVEVSGCDCENDGEGGGEATALLPLALIGFGLRRRRELD